MYSYQYLEDEPEGFLADAASFQPNSAAANYSSLITAQTFVQREDSSALPPIFPSNLSIIKKPDITLLQAKDDSNSPVNSSNTAALFTPNAEKSITVKAVSTPRSKLKNFFFSIDAHGKRLIILIVMLSMVIIASVICLIVLHKKQQMDDEIETVKTDSARSNIDILGSTQKSLSDNNIKLQIPEANNSSSINDYDKATESVSINHDNNPSTFFSSNTESLFSTNSSSSSLSSLNSTFLPFARVIEHEDKGEIDKKSITSGSLPLQIQFPFSSKRHSLQIPPNRIAVSSLPQPQSNNTLSLKQNRTQEALAIKKKKTLTVDKGGFASEFNDRNNASSSTLLSNNSSTLSLSSISTQPVHHLKPKMVIKNAVRRPPNKTLPVFNGSTETSNTITNFSALSNKTEDNDEVGGKKVEKENALKRKIIQAEDCFFTFPKDKAPCSYVKTATVAPKKISQMTADNDPHEFLASKSVPDNPNSTHSTFRNPKAAKTKISRSAHTKKLDQDDCRALGSKKFPELSSLKKRPTPSSEKVCKSNPEAVTNPFDPDFGKNEALLTKKVILKTSSVPDSSTGSYKKSHVSEVVRRMSKISGSNNLDPDKDESNPITRSSSGQTKVRHAFKSKDRT